MERASEASKEQIKMMGTKEQNSENPSVNEIRSADNRKQSSSRRPLTKYAATAKRKTISRMSAEKECEILAGKLYMPW